jgi:hypothetical protein
MSSGPNDLVLFIGRFHPVSVHLPIGGYDPQLLPWHKWSGIAVAVTCTLTWLLNWLGPPRVYQVSLLGTLAVLAVASHLGASIRTAAIT